MWRTDSVGHPQVQYGVVFGIWILASHTFKPKISVYSRKAAIDSTFICPLYRGRVAFAHRVLHIVAFCTFAAFSQRRFHSLSAYLVMYIVNLHLYYGPLSSIALAVLFWRGTSSLLIVVVAPIFFIPSL